MDTGIRNRNRKIEFGAWKLESKSESPASCCGQKAYGEALAGVLGDIGILLESTPFRCSAATGSIRRSVVAASSAGAEGVACPQIAAERARNGVSGKNVSRHVSVATTRLRGR